MYLCLISLYHTIPLSGIFKQKYRTTITLIVLQLYKMRGIGLIKCIKTCYSWELFHYFHQQYHDNLDTFVSFAVHSSRDALLSYVVAFLENSSRFLNHHVQILHYLTLKLDRKSVV